MWPLAIVAGIAANIMAWWLAERCARAGWPAMSRLLQFLRWPILAAAAVVAVGLARQAAAGSLAWQALVTIGGALAGLATTLAVYAAFRFFRTARRGRGDAAP